MKKILILLFIAITTIFFSCEQESIENLDEQLIVKEELDTETNAKWFGYCNSFKGRVRFQFVLNLTEANPASRTGTFILDYCPNGDGSCFQAMQRTVRHDKPFSFYVLGAEFSDPDKFRVRILPNNDGDFYTNSVFMFLGPQYGIERNLGARNIVSGQANFNNLSFDFPAQCNNNIGNTNY
ncbi:hypothetical protein [uncultured Aquimarina sp.]|uniref:hypothetical protein n=1 Tax=uncultured Aquimarina sp. TaxID=575652 RepID=UPI0026206D54|nr:hypothetical protein [uncultured Aquimarina sp.]